jgi:hypothetical protein
MEKTRKPSSHALSGVTAPPIEPEAAEEYRKKWGMYPPKAHTLLIPPEYRLKPSTAEAKPLVNEPSKKP